MSHSNWITTHQLTKPRQAAVISGTNQPQGNGTNPTQGNGTNPTQGNVTNQNQGNVTNQNQGNATNQNQSNGTTETQDNDTIQNQSVENNNETIETEDDPTTTVNAPAQVWHDPRTWNSTMKWAVIGVVVSLLGNWIGILNCIPGVNSLPAWIPFLAYFGLWASASSTFGLFPKGT